MIDKEIMIDGINVTGCEFYCYGYCTLSNDRDERLPFAKKCNRYPDCIYKQLKRKEQECEKLTKNYTMVIQLDQLKAEKAKLEAQIDADTQYYIEEERNLRKIIRNKEKRNIELYKENNQLKAKKKQAEQKLERIRSIYKSCCELMCSGATKETCESCFNTEILQIIDEVK